MDRFKIERISDPVTYWEDFCENVISQDNLPKSALDLVEYNSDNILELLSDSKSVLVFGQVQSGKTLNYSGLISRTLEEKVDLIVVLAGTKTNLVDQTYDRLKGYFNSSPSIDVVKMSKDLNLSLELEKIHRYDSKKLILISLKHQDYLQKMRFELHHNAVQTIIIDDEADQASLNTKEYYSHRNNTNDMSRIYSELRSILNSDFVNLVQYTATPQALFLLSTDNALSPEKYYVQHPPEAYLGINELLNSNRNHLVEVSDFDSSYKYVIDQYIKTCYKLVSQHDFDSNISCLIHSDWRTAQLKEDYRNVVNYINDYSFDSEEWQNLENEKISIDKFKSYFIGSYCIYDVFNKKTVVEWGKHQFIILIGGNMLERGFTIPGLVSTILTRNNKGASKGDTLQQRCRFLGYRGVLKDYLKVYTTKAIIEDLVDYDQSQTILLEEINESGITTEFSRSFAMKFLLPTRQNVLPASLKRSLTNNNLLIHRKVDNFDFVEPLLERGLLKANEILSIKTDVLFDIFQILGLPPFLMNDEYIMVALFGQPNNPRLRTFKTKNKVNQLFQGRSVNYPGDRYIYEGQYHLQIHLVQNKDSVDKHIYFVTMNGAKFDIVYLDHVL